MRADRLVSVLMLLQARGRMTARALAHELEVSERTIYRDLDALSAAGIPVFAERGPGGGCALVEGYRTTLTGLTQNEVRALFMLASPASLAELGMSQSLRSAFQKLAAALPAARRHEEEHVRQRIYLDPEGGPAHEGPVPYLRMAHQAVWESRRLHLVYRLPFDSRVEWLLDPYGLVARAGAWHLVAAKENTVRVLRMSQVVGARLSNEAFERPEAFDLAGFWRTWCAGEEDRRPRFPVQARVLPELVPIIAQHFGDEVALEGPHPTPGDDGRLAVTLCFESLEAARERILGYGRAMEVVAPWELRESVLDYARQIVAMYRGGD